MTTRREAIGVLGSISIGSLLAAPSVGPIALLARARGASWSQDDSTPALAPGAPMSPERLALIAAFRRASDGLDQRFEARSYTSGWTMPYRLFRPRVVGKLPLVLYLHGSGALGDDNVKQMGLGNIFGTRVWALPANQKTFPCYVVAPQTDRGWMRYDDPSPGDSVARLVPGLGEGARLALEIVDALCKELDIDERRIYITGQSMGGGGVWHMTAHRPRFFAAAAICCASATNESALRSASTPVWSFHGDADKSVPVAVSRDRIATLREAGAHPLYTEYTGIGHDVWEWAFTEPALVRWVFSRRRPA